jgi:hypothetical protein
MIPKIKVSPAAIRNNVMPACRPLKTCSSNNVAVIFLYYRDKINF